MTKITWDSIGRRVVNGQLDTAFQEFVVTEISKTVSTDRLNPTSIAVDFTNAINMMASEGFLLHSFQVNRVMLEPTTLNEMVIAVFQRRADASSTRSTSGATDATIAQPAVAERVDDQLSTTDRSVAPQPSLFD